MSEGLCQCGCGKRTPIASRNRYDLGHVKGRPTPYVRGHGSKTLPTIDGTKLCAVCRNFLPLTEFRVLKKGPHSRCRACEAEEQRGRPRRPHVKPRQIDPVQNRARVKRWREENPEKRRAAARRYWYRRRRHGTPEGVEYAEKILRSDPCSYCGAPATTIDHIEPIDLGGNGEWGNLTAACLSCNSRKGPKPLLLFLHDHPVNGRLLAPNGKRYV